MRLQRVCTSAFKFQFSKKRCLSCYNRGYSAQIRIDFQVNFLFTLLHTNDFHNKLTPEKAARLKAMRAEIGDQGALFDAGDACGSGNITFKLAGESILEEMTDIGYDAMTVGNRDFHVSQLGFKSKLFRAGFPILCANVRNSQATQIQYSENLNSEISLDLSDDDKNPPRKNYVNRYLYLQSNPEWKTLIIGLTVPMVTERMWERKLSAYIFDDPLKIALSLIPCLKQRLKPDLTVALTHVGISTDRRLAESDLGIDLIVGGHTHEVLPEGERIGDCLIVQAGSHGRCYGRVEAHKNTEGKPILTARVFEL